MKTTQDYLIDLIYFKTVQGKNAEMQKCFYYIHDIISSEIKNWNYREYNSQGVISRVYSHQDYIDSDEKNFDIYLYGNIDVVDGKRELFVPIKKNGKIFGRGASDMKFGNAVNISLLKKLQEKNPEILKKKIAYIITSDEEMGGLNGIRHIAQDLKYRGKCVIGMNGMPDKNSYNLELKNKGCIHTKYISKGKPSHGSRKWLGENALDKLIDFYHELRETFDLGSEKVWKSTLNLGALNGGFATNAVADKGTMQIDFRYTSETDRSKYYETEKTLMKKYKINDLFRYVDATFVDVNENNEFLQKYKNSILKFISEKNLEMKNSYGSHDLRELFRVGIVPLMLMPRSGGNHTDEEFIVAKDLDKLVEINFDFILNFDFDF